MARTFKRRPVDIPTSSDNYSKHFNQIGFKGIMRKNNLFEVDQLSLRNAKNVYLDEDSILVSRPPIVVETLPESYTLINGVSTLTSVLPSDYVLVDIQTRGDVTIYVGQNAIDEYYIVARLNTELLIKPLLELVTKYHISWIQRYVIVFNDKDAMVLKIDQFDEGWKPLRELAEIPITKRVVGQDTSTYPSNQFTKTYKEEYVWSNDVLDMLPSGTANITVNTAPTKTTWTLPNANINTEFRLMRPINVRLQLSDIITASTNINTGSKTICIARQDNVLISLDGGLTFKRYLYPNHGGFSNIASISKDGSKFFFVAEDGVHWLEIGTNEWEHITITSDGQSRVLSGKGLNNNCCFLSENTFAFVLYSRVTVDNVLESVADIYWRGPGLKSEDYDVGTLGKSRVFGIDGDSQLNKTRADCATQSILIQTVNDVTSVCAWLASNASTTSTFISILGASGGDCEVISQTINKPYGMLNYMEVITSYELPNVPSTEIKGVKIRGYTTEDNIWYSTEAIIGFIKGGDPLSWEEPEEVSEFLLSDSTRVEMSSRGAPLFLGTGYISDFYVYSIDGIARLPEELNGIRTGTIIDGSTFYIIIDEVLYTNYMIPTSSTVLTYTYFSLEPYTEVPNISHVNNELYLTFKDTLKITANLYQDSSIVFNLPSINDHIFTSTITGLINISTTEVAIFLVDQIYQVSQVPDELTVYRYDYYNTRLSVGIRLGDSVINTQDGLYTLYPTPKGLAAMNYQPDVATTDQIVEYLTKDIQDIWTEFYKAGPISILQLKDYIYLTNSTRIYLMLDLRQLSWWLFESPIPVSKMRVDDFELKIVSRGLYKFFTESEYKDLGYLDIDWFIESQALHFDAPNHYKNLRQLIFHLEETDEVDYTINSQIKLYRKRVSIKPVDVINFKIEGYRTHIKRFNYWKINELQWMLSADEHSRTPKQFKLNGLTIKFEMGEEVRS